MDQDLNSKINALSDDQLEALLNLILEMNEHKDEIVTIIGTQMEYLTQSLANINTVATILALPKPPVRRMIPSIVRRMIPEIADHYPRLMNFPAEMSNLRLKTCDMVSQLESEIKAIKDIEANIAKLLM